MPNGATQTVPSDPNASYTAVDPRKDPLAFLYQNRDALDKMKDPGHFLDRMFDRIVLPKYQSINKH
jgi:hypothetical protein